MSTTARRHLRTFGCLQWECMDPGLWWEFNDGWGTYSLRKYNGRVQVRGWYLYGGTTPLGGTYMGKTLTAATAAAEPVILADRKTKVSA